MQAVLINDFNNLLFLKPMYREQIVFNNDVQRVIRLLNTLANIDDQILIYNRLARQKVRIENLLIEPKYKY